MAGTAILPEDQKIFSMQELKSKGFSQYKVSKLVSAAVYYHLTTFIPDAVDVAIPRKAKVSTMPDWPQMNPVKTAMHQ